MSNVRWVKTTADVYNAIYGQHRKELCLHGTITDTSDYHGAPHIMTEWGLPGAYYPLIKYDIRGEDTTYWLAAVKQEDDQ